MPQMAEADFKRHMESGPLSGLYLLYGEEKYLVRRNARKLIRKVTAELPFPDFNFQRFDGTASVDDIAAAVESLPFMAEQKCVAVSDLAPDSLRASDYSKWQELLAGVPESTVLVIYQPNTNPEKKATRWNALLKLAGKYGRTVSFAHREGAELEKWLCAEASKKSCTISRRDARKMVELCGEDMQSLHNEIQKLCAYVMQGEISGELIEKMVARRTETTVFMLSRALVAGEYNRAYQLLDQMCYQNEEPITVLAVLSSAFVDMYRVRSAVQSGARVTDLAQSFAGEYKGREFRLRNAEREVKRLSTEQLRQILSELLRTDLALKSSRTESRILLEEMIARIMVITAKGRQD